MHQIRVMDRRGDTSLDWQPEVEESTALAEQLFQQKVSVGYMAFAVMPGTDEREQIREFDPNAQMIVMVPPLVGG